MENKKENDAEVSKKSEKEMKEIAYGKQLVLAKSKNDYISNMVNARYFLARYNMLAEQIQKGEIKEMIDGCPKSMEFMRSEAALMKVRAITAFRETHFGQLDMKKDFGLLDEDIQAIEVDYYDGKIIRETYDEGYKKGSKAEFVNQ